MKTALLIAALLCSAALALAQDEAQIHNGLDFTTPLTITAGREDQMLVGTEKITDNTSIISGPTMRLYKGGPRGNFDLHYTPEFQLFQNRTDLNSWNHSAGFLTEYRMTERLTNTTSDSFLNTQDPTRSLGESAFLLPRQSFTENMFNAALSYGLGPATTFSLSYGNTLSDLLEPVNQITPRLLEMANVGTVGLSHTFGEHNRVSAEYSVLKLRDFGSRAASLNQQPAVTQLSHSAGFGYSYTGLRGFYFGATAGVTRGGIDSYAVSGQIGKRWTSVLVELGYTRQLSAFRSLLSNTIAPVDVTGAVLDSRIGTGVQLNSVFQAATLRYREKFGYRVGMELRALAGRTNNLGSLPPNIDSATGRLRFYFRLASRFSFFTGAEFYNQNFNQLLGTSLERKRFYAGMMISVARRAQPMEMSGQEQSETDQRRDIAADWPADWGTE